MLTLVVENKWNPMNRSVLSTQAFQRSLSFGGLCFCFCLLAGCNLRSDAELSRLFVNDQTSFAELITMARSDQHLRSVTFTANTKRPESLSQARLEEYRVLCRRLHLEGFVRRDDFPNAIFLRADCKGTAITHDCKGFAYSEAPLAPEENNLDRAPARIAFRALSENWYLYREDE